MQGWVISVFLLSQKRQVGEADHVSVNDAKIIQMAHDSMEMVDAIDIGAV